MKRNGKNNANSFKDMPKVHVVRIDNEQNRKQIAAEQAAAKQALYVDYWESMTENEYMNNVRMINTNQFDILSPIFQDEELLEFFKMKKKQEAEQSDQDSKTFFELLPNMHESVQMSMIEFINDHHTDEQTHVDYMSLVKMAREKAIHEHEVFELHNQSNKLEQKKFDDFWSGIHQPDKMGRLEVLKKAIDSKVIDINILNYITQTVGLPLNDFLTMWEVKQAQQAQLRENLLKFAEGKEEQAEHEENAEQENEEQEKFLSFWKSLDESKKDLCVTGLHSGYIATVARIFVNENFKDETVFLKLLKTHLYNEPDLTTVHEELETEEQETEVQNEILTETPTTENMKSQKEVASEVKKEVSKSQKATKKAKLVTETTVNNTQSIVNNTLNLTLEKEKPKMSIADKIIEAQKMLVIAERKQITEDRLKAFHGYLHANKEGDNFKLMSLDEKYSFSTNNIELIKEVNTVLEKFFKTKIQEFETELTNFQI